MLLKSINFNFIENNSLLNINMSIENQDLVNTYISRAL